jgi:hypothetical protein
MDDNSTPTAAIDGQGPPGDRQGRPVAAVTTAEALFIFQDAGFRRSLRSLERYCKNGRLEAYLHPDEGAYYISRESVEHLVGEFREVQERRLGSVAAVSPTMPASSGHRPPLADSTNDGDVEEIGRKLEKITEERDSAQLDARVRQGVISQLTKQIKEDREHYTDLLAERSHRIGTLEERLLQIEGPREAATNATDKRAENATEDEPYLR